MAYLTRRERERLKVIRVRKQREKRGKHPILTQTFLANEDILTSLNYNQLRYFNDIWFTKYLLEKLKNLNMFKYYFYVNFKKTEIAKSFRILEDSNRINTDILLYKLIWDKFFDSYVSPLNQTKYFKCFKRFKGSFENNPKLVESFWPKIYSFEIPTENSINHFNFINSLLVDFDLYLKPLNIKVKIQLQKENEKDLTFFPANWLETVLNYDSQEVESLQNMYKESNELFIEEYEKSLLPPDFKELEPYFNYLDLPDTKQIPNLLISKRKRLEEFYIENFMLEEINVKNNPYSYIDIKKLKNLLNNLKLTEKEKEFQIKLCLTHNANLKFLKIPLTYIDFQSTINKKNLSDYSLISDINKIKYIENSKVFTDTNIYLLFINKTVLNFIEIFLLKFKTVLPLNKLLNTLYKSLTNKEELVVFYNMLVKEFNLIKYKLTLYSIRFILEFLELLYDIIRTIDNYENILLFNIQKLKFLYKDFSIFDLMYFKRFLMFEYNDDTNWLTFLLETYSTTCIVNLNYYSMLISDYIIKYYQDIPEDLNLKTLIFNKNFKINIFKYYFRYQFVNNLLKFLLFNQTYRKMYVGKNIGFANRDRNFVFLGHYLPFYDSLFDNCNDYISDRFFLPTNSLINLVRYKYTWTCKTLKKAMLRRSNMEFVLFNIDDLKLNPFVFADQYYKLHQILTTSILKTNKTDFDIWDLVNNKMEFPGLTKPKRLLLFLAYANLMVYICFNNTNLLDGQKNNFKSFISRFAVFLKQLKLRRQPNPQAPLLKQVYKEGKLIDLRKYKPVQRKPYTVINLEEIMLDLKKNM